MSVQEPGLWNRTTAHPWRAALAAFVLLYCPLLACIYSTTDFSAEADAQRRIAKIMNGPPAPPQPLPVLKTFERPDLVMRRDPLQPPARNLSPPESGDTAANASASFRFVASYRDEDRACAVSRNSADQLARLCVGDEIADGTIDQIDFARVTINAGGKPHVMEIAPVTLAH